MFCLHPYPGGRDARSLLERFVRHTMGEDAPLGEEAIRLVLWLGKRGYCERSRRESGHAVVHLGRVLHEAGKEVTAQGLDEKVIESFVYQHMPVCSCYQRRSGRRTEQARHGLARLLTMLREEGVIPCPTSPQPHFHELLEGYCQFLREHRGLAETTIVNCRRYVRDFLTKCGDAATVTELAQMTEEDVLAFGRERGASLGATAWNHVALSLSSFWRWLDLRGHGTRHLVGAVPLRRKYRLADVPCALSWEQVRRLLAVVDRSARNGRRNYAMLLLIATYGLRGCEVRVLRIDDIDWSNDEITIFAPKTGLFRKLPLMQPVGEAILEYLREERPPSLHREIFLSSRPPNAPLRSKLNTWLSHCFDRAGIEVPRRGAHTLRHSLAGSAASHLHPRGGALTASGCAIAA